MKNFTYLSFLFLVFFAANFLGGCGTTSGITGSKVYMQDSKVKIDNDSLARALNVTDLKSILVNDLLKASVMLQSKRTDTLELQYKIRWYDAQGMEIDAESCPWKPVIIYGRGTENVQALAPNPSAKEFKIEVRYRDKK